MGYTAAYLGLPGSFSYQAAREYFNENNSFISKLSFNEIFEVVSYGTCDYGIIPIENTTIGMIEQVNSLLKKYNVVTSDKITIQINLHLLVNKKINITNINKIYSRAEAFGQCSYFFKQNPDIEIGTISDTASAAKHVAQSKRVDIAAIASDSAAKLYQLDILKKNIQNKKNNKTKFLIIKRK